MREEKNGIHWAAFYGDLSKVKVYRDHVETSFESNTSSIVRFETVDYLLKGLEKKLRIAAHFIGTQSKYCVWSWSVIVSLAHRKPIMPFIITAGILDLVFAKSDLLRPRRKKNHDAFYLDNICNLDGWKPLDFAAAGGSIEVAKHLIEQGADPEACNTSYGAFLDVAKYFGNEVFEKCLSDVIKDDRVRLQLTNRIAEQDNIITAQQQDIERLHDRSEILRAAFDEITLGLESEEIKEEKTSSSNSNMSPTHDYSPPSTANNPHGLLSGNRDVAANSSGLTPSEGLFPS